MWEHHRRAIERWVATAQREPEFLAVIVAGSLTKGYGAESSDVDGFIVVSDREFVRRCASGEIFWYRPDLCDYEGGYIDAKCVSLEWLHKAESRGSEPARSAFIGAEVPWARVSGLPELCERITRYPEDGREDRMRRFVAQIEFSKWFLGEGERRNNPYLVTLSAARLALFVSRLLLAHNRILYPYHKWMLMALAGAPEKPDGILARVEGFLRHASGPEAVALAEEVLAFRPWPKPESGWPNLILKDSEWNWLHHEPPIEDL